MLPELLHFCLFLILSFLFACVLEYARLNIKESSLPKEKQVKIDLLATILGPKGFEVSMVGFLMALSFGPDLKVILYWSMQFIMLYMVSQFIETPIVKNKKIGWTVAMALIVPIMVMINVNYYG